MKNLITPILILLLMLSNDSWCQEKGIVKIIDDLTIQWDERAITIDSYEGLEQYCHNRTTRTETIALLDKIHHYDTVLLNIVTTKYNTEKDKEAKATLDDIETLEVDYTTLSFKKFLRVECGKLNDIEKNFGRAGGDTYNEEVKRLEEELDKYIISITRRIDLIDEHVHHLKGLK